MKNRVIPEGAPAPVVTSEKRKTMILYNGKKNPFKQCINKGRHFYLPPDAFLSVTAPVSTRKNKEDVRGGLKSDQSLTNGPLEISKTHHRLLPLPLHHSTLPRSHSFILPSSLLPRITQCSFHECGRKEALTRWFSDGFGWCWQEEERRRRMKITGIPSMR